MSVARAVPAPQDPANMTAHVGVGDVNVCERDVGVVEVDLLGHIEAPPARLHHQLCLG